MAREPSRLDKGDTMTPDRYCPSCGGVDNNPTDDEHVCYCERPRGPAARVIAICAACNGEAKTKGGGRPVVVAHAPDCTELQRLTGLEAGSSDHYRDIVAKHTGIPRSNIVIRRIC